MSNHGSIRKLCVVMPLFIALSFLLIIPSTAILISNNSRFGPTNHVYGQSDQMNSNITNSLNIQNMPIKKVHVGDIDIARFLVKVIHFYLSAVVALSWMRGSRLF